MRSMYDWIALSNSATSGTGSFGCLSDIATGSTSGEKFETLCGYRRLSDTRREAEAPPDDSARLLQRNHDGKQRTPVENRKQGLDREARLAREADGRWLSLAAPQVDSKCFAKVPASGYIRSEYKPSLLVRQGIRSAPAVITGNVCEQPSPSRLLGLAGWTTSTTASHRSTT
jgi:hypothetical protein